jgi:hypothetical protein
LLLSLCPFIVNASTNKADQKENLGPDAKIE